MKELQKVLLVVQIDGRSVSFLLRNLYGLLPPTIEAMKREPAYLTYEQVVKIVTTLVAPNASITKVNTFIEQMLTHLAHERRQNTDLASKLSADIKADINQYSQGDCKTRDYFAANYLESEDTFPERSSVQWLLETKLI